MSLLIDGHNLIPHVGGLSLRALDDEERLIELLQVYCRVNNKNVRVFFDRAAPGHAGQRAYGRVKAQFVRQGRTADAAIIQRLRKAKKAARNFTVVSSDRRVQAEARALGAAIIPSDQFARQLAAARDHASYVSPDESSSLSQGELAEWLRMFGADEEE
jgi:predicted RNA-binding protein with PIN domain